MSSYINPVLAERRRRTQELTGKVNEVGFHSRAAAAGAQEARVGREANVSIAKSGGLVAGGGIGAYVNDTSVEPQSTKFRPYAQQLVSRTSPSRLPRPPELQAAGGEMSQHRRGSFVGGRAPVPFAQDAAPLSAVTSPPGGGFGPSSLSSVQDFGKIVELVYRNNAEAHQCYLDFSVKQS